MNRRAVVVPILLLAGAATGCSTFSDNDAAARVGEFELSQDALGDLLIAATPDDPPAPGIEPVDESEASAETAREPAQHLDPHPDRRGRPRRRGATASLPRRSPM